MRTAWRPLWIDGVASATHEQEKRVIASGRAPRRRKPTVMQAEPNRDGPDGNGITRTTLVIVEDHAMVAQGLSAALDEEDGMEVKGMASTAREAVEMVGHQAPDVALIDFRLPDGDGAQLAAAVRSLRPEIRMVMLTAADDPDVLARAIDAGIAGFVHKSEPIEEVVRAIRAVKAGERWFRPEVLVALVETVRRPPPAVGDDLTVRERDVLDLLAQGASTQAMIETLVLSPHTVRNHVRNIMMKLGTHSKLEAVTVAARAGIVSLGRSPDPDGRVAGSKL